MQNIVLGMQGGRADGTEETFDGQPMQPGVHLRWSFRPELGFPAGGFWLCRRMATPGERLIPVPAMPQRSDPPVVRFVVTIGPDPESDQCLATISPPCRSLTMTGRGGSGAPGVTIGAFAKNATGEFVEVDSQTVPIVDGVFGAQFSAGGIALLRMTNVIAVDHASCTAD
jgi:hypothetical protein